MPSSSVSPRDGLCEPTSLLEFRSVHFSYGKHGVLNGLDLSVKGGEVVGFLGVNGSGKTTTFLLATGFLEPTDGES